MDGPNKSRIMKKLYFLIFILFSVLPNLSANDTISVNHPIVRTLKLNFDSNAKENNVFIEWMIQADFKNLDINFSQGKLTDDYKFRITAANYSDISNGIEGVRLTIKPGNKSEPGSYNFKMTVAEYSDGLERIDLEKLNLEIDNIIIVAPPFNWLRLIIVVLAIIIVVSIIIILIFQKQKFKSGSVLIEEPKEKANTYFLKGNKRFLFSNFCPCDAYLFKGSDGLPKIHYENETVYVNGEYTGKDHQLATMDECEIITLDNEKIKFVYQ
jgi:hypothetical protein